MSTTPDTPRRTAGQVVPSVIRAVRVLDALAESGEPMGLAALSRRLELPRSSTLAVCNSLVETGMLRRRADGTYAIGLHVLELSRSYLGQADLSSAFQRAVADRLVLPEHTVVCAVLSEDDVVYIARRGGRSPVAVNYEVGMRLPAHCTASGLAMLSTLDDEELAERYDDRPLRTLTPRSIGSPDALRERLAVVRERGYAVDDEETALGMTCIGAVVRDAGGTTAGALAISFAKLSLDPGEQAALATELVALAGRISADLGGRTA